MINPLKWFRTRRVRREQAKRERLGMAYHVKLSPKYLRFHMIRALPERELS